MNEENKSKTQVVVTLKQERIFIYFLIFKYFVAA
jgi:hypothetical protein